MPVARAKSASSSRGGTGSRSRTGSSSRASSGASKGSKKSKAALKLANKAERLHDNATEYIEKGDSKAGLKELAKLIRLHAKHQKKCLEKRKTPTLGPAWEIAEEYVLMANSEMVFRAAAMDAQQDVQWLSREALRFLGPADEKDAETGSKSPGSSRSSSASSSKSKKKAAPNYLVGQTALKKALKAMVLNNQAVQRWVAEEPLDGVIVLLQRALAASDGIFCSLILYNLAVCFMACGRFEDTTETIARCLEITNGCMQQIKPPSMRRLIEEEEAANRPKSAPKKKKKGATKGGAASKGADSRKSAAAPPPKPASRSPAGRAGSSKKGKKKKVSPVVVPLTEEQLAEIARQEKLTELRRRWKIYSTFIVVMATHTILCHHAIATLAVWCDMEGMEQYHCELAMGCAKKYLPCSHPMQKRCRDRLHNVTNGLLPRIKPHGGIPPQLPLLTQADFIATPCAAAAALPEEESPFPSVSTAAKMPPVRVSELLSLATTVSKPSELTEFMRAMAAQVKAAKKAAAKKGRGRSNSLPVLRPGSSSSRNGRRPSTSPSPGRSGSTGSARKRRRRATADSKSLMLERLLPPLHEDPPVGMEGPQFVTKVPRIAYERYERLKETTIHYLSTSGVITESRPVTGEPQAESPLQGKERVNETPALHPLQVHKRRDSMLTSVAKITRANGAQVPPPELMVAYDGDLKRMSHLVKDFMPEIRFRAAQMIQRQWRYYAAHLERERRARAIQEWMKRAMAASDILHYYRRWKERLPSILKARELRRLQTKAKQLTKIQSFLYQMQSIQEWGRRCAAMYERLLEEKRQREKEAAAATMIQSVWRMYAEKLARKREYTAATKIQTQWRCRTARKVLMAKRVHKKLMYEQFLRSVEDKIIYIQRWYRACKARQAVAGLLDRKKKEIEDYLRREEDWFDRELGHLMDDPNLETKIRKVMSVLRGAKIRQELHMQWKSRRIINEALTKMVLRRRGTNTLAELREEKHQRDALRRRREEIADSATRIQALVRQRQARQHLNNLKECFAMMDDAASRIQRAYRTHCRMVLLAKATERQQLRDESKDMAKLREYAATRIQALWRGRKEREGQSEFLDFMQMGRHRLARKIQCAWRKSRAKSQAKMLSQTVREDRESTALHRQKCVAATKIASVIRMYRVRKQLAEEGRSLAPTDYILYYSARKIQCAWRCFASRQYVHQLKLATAYSDTEKVSQEALHAYATLIQSIVRSKILNPIRVAVFRKLFGKKDNDEAGAEGGLTADGKDGQSDDSKEQSSEETQGSDSQLDVTEESVSHPGKSAPRRVSCMSSGKKKDPKRHIRFILPGEDQLRTVVSSSS